MTKHDHPNSIANTSANDRPSPSVPSVDRPWDDAAALERRLTARTGDRAAHRMHHSLYEDMLN
jgi:hypothetical protein